MCFYILEFSGHSKIKTIERVGGIKTYDVKNICIFWDNNCTVYYRF